MFVPQHPWANKAAKLILQKLVSQVPIVGPILADVVTVIWPAPDCPEATSEEQFEQIRSHVAALIEEKLAQRVDGATDGESAVVCIAESATCDFAVETLSPAEVWSTHNPSLIQMVVGDNSTTTVAWTSCGSGEISEFTSEPIRKEDELVMPLLESMLAVG